MVGQQDREAAEESARRAAQSGDRYMELIAEGLRYMSKQDWRKAAKKFREGIALDPDEPVMYFNLGNVLQKSGHYVEAAQRFLEAKERYPVDSVDWAEATARAFELLMQDQCDKVARPEWWNDEGLKALSARVVRAAPNDPAATSVRAIVLTGQCRAWESGPRSAAELNEAAAHFERAVALCDAPAQKEVLAGNAVRCHSLAEAMYR